MGYCRHMRKGGRTLNQNENISAENNAEEQNKPLAKSAQVIFTVAVGILAFLYASGLLGIVGALLVILCVAMETLLLFEFATSKVKISVLFAVNIAACVAASIYLGSAILALGALYVPFMAIPIWLTVRAGYGRAASIAFAAVGAMVVWCVSFAMSIITELGAFNAETLGSLLDKMFEPYAAQILELTEGENGIASITLTTADMDMLRYYFKTLFFGSVGVAMTVWAYFSTLVIRLIASVFKVAYLIPHGYRVGVRASITPKGPTFEISREEVVWRFELDNVTAAIYIAAYLLSVLLAPANGTVSAAYIVASNLILLLTPAFFYCGARDAVLSFRGKSALGGITRIGAILALVLVVISPPSVVIVLSAIGVAVTLRENRARKTIQKTGKE